MSNIKDSVYEFNERKITIHVKEERRYRPFSDWRLQERPEEIVPAHEYNTTEYTSLPSITFKCDMCRKTVTYISKDDFTDIFNLGYWETNIHLCGDCLTSERRTRIIS